MALVVDTDVIAAALLGEESRGREAAEVLASFRDLMAPSHWKAELASVVWKYVELSGQSAQAVRVDDIFDAAERLPIASIDVNELWRGALARAIAARHSPYDALFVELAAREGARLVSYDAKLRRKFPDVAISPTNALRSRSTKGL